MLERRRRTGESVGFCCYEWVIACSRECKQEKGEVTGGRVRSERKATKDPASLFTAAPAPRLASCGRPCARDPILSLLSLAVIERARAHAKAWEDDGWPSYAPIRGPVFSPAL